MPSAGRPRILSPAEDQELLKRYRAGKESVREIGNYFGVSEACVHKTRRHYGEPGNRKRGLSAAEGVLVLEYWDAGKSVNQIATDLFGRCPGSLKTGNRVAVVRRWLRAQGIEPEGRPANLSGSTNPNWKGHRKPHKTKEGYVRVWLPPEHPLRVMAHKTGWLAEHRVVLAEKLGRALYPDENAHHKNGVKDDNRPTNLELWVTKQPKGQRAEDLLAWAHEILKRYGPPALP